MYVILLALLALKCYADCDLQIREAYFKGSKLCKRDGKCYTQSEYKQGLTDNTAEIVRAMRIACRRIRPELSWKNCTSYKFTGGHCPYCSCTKDFQELFQFNVSEYYGQCYKLSCSTSQGVVKSLYLRQPVDGTCKVKGTCTDVKENVFNIASDSYAVSFPGQGVQRKCKFLKCKDSALTATSWADVKKDKPNFVKSISQYFGLPVSTFLTFGGCRDDSTKWTDPTFLPFLCTPFCKCDKNAGTTYAMFSTDHFRHFWQLRGMGMSVCTKCTCQSYGKMCEGMNVFHFKTKENPTPDASKCNIPPLTCNRADKKTKQDCSSDRYCSNGDTTNIVDLAVTSKFAVKPDTGGCGNIFDCGVMGSDISKCLTGKVNFDYLHYDCASKSVKKATINQEMSLKCRAGNLPTNEFIKNKNECKQDNSVADLYTTIGKCWRGADAPKERLDKTTAMLKFFGPKECEAIDQCGTAGFSTFFAVLNDYKCDNQNVLDILNRFSECICQGAHLVYKKVKGDSKKLELLTDQFNLFSASLTMGLSEGGCKPLFKCDKTTGKGSFEIETFETSGKTVSRRRLADSQSERERHEAVCMRLKGLLGLLSEKQCTSDGKKIVINSKTQEEADAIKQKLVNLNDPLISVSEVSVKVNKQELTSGSDEVDSARVTNFMTVMMLSSAIVFMLFV